MFEVIFGLILLGLFLVFLLWLHGPAIRGKLKLDEVEHFMSIIERQLKMPEEERAQFVASLREWANADDGKPFYMLSLMRYHPELLYYGEGVGFKGTPQESNAYYEKAVAPIVIRNRGIPLIAATPQGRNLMAHEPELDNWSNASVMHYPSRRAFLNFMADPDYGPLEPYKTMALKTVAVPVSAKLVVPDLRLVVGAVLLLIFLLVGWIRAAGV